MLVRPNIRKPVALGRSRRPRKRSPTWRVLRYALLAAAALMILTAAIGYSNNKLRRRKTYVILSELTDVVYRFHYDFQRYPETLELLLSPPAGQRPYLQSIPKDAWGNPFGYEVSGDLYSGSFRIVSCGPDGEPGNRDDIASL